MNLTRGMQEYIQESQEELKQLIRDLCAIPAPSHHEELRAEFCKRWFEEAGFPNVFIDEALNVVCPWPAADPGTTVFMAHTDTVFPDTTPLPFREDEDTFYCPAVCDDTGNLAVMMIAARWFLRSGCAPKHSLLFVANSCEEGLGNLVGSKAIVQNYGDRLKGLVTFDGIRFERAVTRAVGSHRYRVTVTTEGGHSYGAFGNRNAIRYLASMIDALYAVKVPEKPGAKTTYNVGLISGGTSVNTIAQRAEMLYEYRSDDVECLLAMKRCFEAVVEAYRAMGIGVEVELVGDRSCANGVNPADHEALIALADRTIRDVIGKEPLHESSSTDANSALGAGIPAVCLSAVQGKGCHTREETLELSSLVPGCRLVMDFMANFFYI